MKGAMTIQALPDTHPGDDLFCLRLELTQMTERELEAAMGAIEQKVYPAIYRVALTPTEPNS
jgi:hypothetical protein